MIDRLQFGFRRRIYPQLQTEATECGLACLGMIAAFYGYEIDLPALRQRFSVSLKGLTMADLVRIGSALQLAGRAVSLELDELQSLRLPCILHWDFQHFVVLERVARDHVVLVDPATGTRKVTWGEMSLHFSGVALELTPTPAFQAKREQQRIGLGDLLGRTTGVGRGLLKVFLLSLALEGFSIVAPFYEQWVVDQAIATGDRNLLTTLALGFGLVTIISIITEALRGWAVTVFSTLVNVQWTANVFRHLTRLPIDYFAKRHIGDIVSRFESIDVIQQSLTLGFVEAILDGVMSTGTFAIMLVYDRWLCLISVCAVLAYAVLRFCLYGALRMSNQQQIVFAARGRSMLMETVRGIQSVRLFGKADERLSRWLNLVVAGKNTGLRTQRLMLVFRTAHQLIFGLEFILVIFLGARTVMDNAMSVGMLFAFLSYRSQFTARLSALIDKFYDLQILKLHATRLADIVLTEREHEGELIRRPDVDIEPSIEVRGLSYAYGKAERRVIDDFGVTIACGESVAVIGPSGCGKTTLLMLLAGLLKPDAGEILVGGIPIRQLGLSNYQSMLGVVMQDDRLFAGSIADNISFFDPAPDDAWIRKCAELASIRDEILAMPMGFHTHIGDMGSALSAGQRQRVMLARALYRRPRILLLDEATSNLDLDNERSVNLAIQALNITRVVIAHRPETIASADRVIDLARAKAEA
ncbi:hypothetical protein BWP39_28140 [Paraburkholderia acidicola]|uniref:Colicin V processing peptidase n=1 Tax=Paraburkholderia acidicola TaxID=1912599 RepID=A0A2A4ETC6_9BURK|nr:peptidase domain-containing ABC transporter [Paraburkholderia acidicola]PCE23554.1 hypothetical protein BWP39_28140 [Paraburkholderia acidicola]